MPHHYDHSSNQGASRTFGGQNIGGFQVPEYPSTPAPLNRGEIRQFGQRRRQASRRLDEALAQRERGAGQARQQFDRLRSDLERQAEDRERRGREQLSGQGMARQPRGIGRALRDIRDDRAAQMAEGRREKSDRLAALDFAVAQARSQRDEELAQIRADKATQRTMLDRLLGGGGGGR